ncbi:hypothetical protein [Nocardiopsis sp. NPDC057823]
MRNPWKKDGEDRTPGWLMAAISGAVRAVVADLIRRFFDGDGPS